MTGSVVLQPDRNRSRASGAVHTSVPTPPRAMLHPSRSALSQPLAFPAIRSGYEISPADPVGFNHRVLQSP